MTELRDSKWYCVPGTWATLVTRNGTRPARVWKMIVQVYYAPYSVEQYALHNCGRVRLFDCLNCQGLNFYFRSMFSSPHQCNDPVRRWSRPPSRRRRESRKIWTSKFLRFCTARSLHYDRMHFRALYTPQQKRLGGGRALRSGVGCYTGIEGAVVRALRKGCAWS